MSASFGYAQCIQTGNEFTMSCLAKSACVPKGERENVQFGGIGGSLQAEYGGGEEHAFVVGMSSNEEDIVQAMI